MYKLIITICFILTVSACATKSSTLTKTISGTTEDLGVGAATIEVYIFDESGKDIAKVGQGALNADRTFSIDLTEPKEEDLAKVSELNTVTCGKAEINQARGIPTTFYVIQNGNRIRSLGQNNDSGNQLANYVYVTQDIDESDDCTYQGMAVSLKNTKLTKGWNNVLIAISSDFKITITTPSNINLPWQ
jgi:hypothetical protein